MLQATELGDDDQESSSTQEFPPLDRLPYTFCTWHVRGRRDSLNKCRTYEPERLRRSVLAISCARTRDWSFYEHVRALTRGPFRGTAACRMTTLSLARATRPVVARHLQGGGSQEKFSGKSCRMLKAIRFRRSCRGGVQQWQERSRGRRDEA